MKNLDAEQMAVLRRRMYAAMEKVKYYPARYDIAALVEEALAPYKPKDIWGFTRQPDVLKAMLYYNREEAQTLLCVARARRERNLDYNPIERVHKGWI